MDNKVEPNVDKQTTNNNGPIVHHSGKSLPSQALSIQFKRIQPANPNTSIDKHFHLASSRVRGPKGCWRGRDEFGLGLPA